MKSSTNFKSSSVVGNFHSWKAAKEKDVRRQAEESKSRDEAAAKKREARKYDREMSLFTDTLERAMAEDLTNFDRGFSMFAKNQDVDPRPGAVLLLAGATRNTKYPFLRLEPTENGSRLESGNVFDNDGSRTKPQLAGRKTWSINEKTGTITVERAVRQNSSPDIRVEQFTMNESNPGLIADHHFRDPI